MIIWLILTLIAPPQDVVVHFDDESRVEARFQAMLRFDADGNGRGNLRLVQRDAEIGVLVLVVALDDVQLDEADGELSVRFAGTGTLRSRSGRVLERGELTGEIGPWRQTQDDPIWQFHSGNVYSGDSAATFQASVLLRGVPQRPAAREPAARERSR